MKLTRTAVVTAVGVAVAVTAVGGVSIAASGGSSGTPYRASAAGSSAAPAARAQHVVVSSATATVGGRSERILVDHHGDPLYLYRPDTATQSRVAGQLAVLWPPLVGGTVTAHGLSGKLRTVPTSHGRQVAYNGHLLYTFVQDKPGKVTGQGVQDFFVVPAGRSTPSSSTAGSAAPSVGGGYGY
jgi:predicted lipoprotein with Yx(FWY)xxD motif